MARPHAFVLALTLFCGCHKQASFPETSPEVEPLRWLDHADVVADFTDRVEHQHDLRFLSVYAFSTANAVGLPDTPELQQLIKKHGERHIEGTTDIISRAEQRRLLSKAHAYVKQYNAMLLKFLRDHPEI
jgi:hypothetical protein